MMTVRTSFGESVPLTGAGKDRDGTSFDRTLIVSTGFGASKSIGRDSVHTGSGCSILVRCDGSAASADAPERSSASDGETINSATPAKRLSFDSGIMEFSVAYPPRW